MKDTPVVILCGGRGTRLQEQTRSIPKPLVEIGGLPILWHVVQIYAAQGFRDFVLLTGYKGELIEDFVATDPWGGELSVNCVETGVDTPTGGRVALANDQLGDSTFALAYADGVADIDLGAALEFHRDHGGLATVTLAQPQNPWGVAVMEPGSDRIAGFVEKPKMEQWINVGFFFLEAGAFEYLDPTSTLEREPLERMASDGVLHGYRHEGFWDCMDTYKDAVLLNDLWSQGDPPWQVWDGEPVR